MKMMKLVLGGAAVLTLAIPRADAAALKVIANASVSQSSISNDDLQQVFLEDKDSLGGTHVSPVLEKEGPTHQAFLKAIGKSDSALQAFYRSLVFSGKGSMPKICSSDAEVVAYVAKTKGAVGYVSPGTSTDGVKVLELK